MLRLAGISHAFGSTVALDNINLALAPGVVGLLGPNGAGKSTLMHIAATALPSQHGQVTVAGHDTASASERELARRSVGYLPQRFSLMGWATAHRNVAYAAWAQGVAPGECDDRAAAALSVVGLDALAARRARTLSGGQRQRLGIACAIAHEPKLLLLDEPTVGLDPVQRSEIRDYLQSVGDGRTVLISTHIVEDLDEIAKRILVLNRGRVIFDGDRETLIAGNPSSSGGTQTMERAYVQLMRAADPTDVVAR